MFTRFHGDILNGCRDVWAEDRLLIAIVVAHVLTVAACLTFTGRDHWLVIRFWYLALTAAWLCTSVLWLVIRWTLLPTRVYGRLTHRLPGALLLLMLAPPFQSAFNSFKRAMPDWRRFSWDPALANIDEQLHGQHAAWSWFAGLVQHNVRALLLLDLTYEFWFLSLLLFLVWAGWTSQRALRRRALLTTLAVWIILGNVMAFTLLSAGPCYYQYVAPQHSDRFSALFAALDSHNLNAKPLLLVARRNEMVLWRWFIAGENHPFGGVSAMPSLHVAMAMVMLLTAWARHRLIGFIAGVYFCLIQVGSVVLGWHYGIDGYVASAATIGIWYLVGYLDVYTTERRRDGALDGALSTDVQLT